MTASLRYEDGGCLLCGDDRSSPRLRWVMAHEEQDRQQLGAQLALARVSAGFTMEAAATELTKRGYPVVKQTIGAWEKGRNLPDALWLKRLARLYGTTADALLGLVEDAAWPFKNVKRADIMALEPEDRGHLSGVLASELERLLYEPTEADAKSATASTVSMTRRATKRKAA